MDDMFAAVLAGELEPIVGGTYPLSDARRAHEDLRARTTAELGQEGFAEDGITLEWFFDMRYAGQAYEIRVPVELHGAHVAAATVERAIDSFHTLHERHYGYSYEGESQVEVVNVGITGFGRFERLAAGAGRADQHAWEELRKATRPVVVARGGEPVECGVYDRPLGALREALPGPAIVEQYDSTVLVEDGWQATALQSGHLALDRVA